VGGWDPFTDGFRVVERLGGRFRDGWPGDALLDSDEGAALAPPLDVFEDAEGLCLELELPGISARDLVVTVDADAVRIEAERTFSHAGGRRVHALEGRYGRMRREIPLPVRAVPGRAVAELVRGVLRIRIPRAPEPSPTTRRLSPADEAPVRVELDAPLS
jgi:HSP20 family protein